jgi:hypothetical protein
VKALAVLGALALALTACGGHPAAPKPTVAGCAKAIEAHPDAADWNEPSMAPCKGLTDDQRVKATAIAAANGAVG